MIRYWWIVANCLRILHIHGAKTQKNQTPLSHFASLFYDHMQRQNNTKLWSKTWQRGLIFSVLAPCICSILKASKQSLSFIVCVTSNMYTFHWQKALNLHFLMCLNNKPTFQRWQLHRFVISVVTFQKLLATRQMCTKGSFTIITCYKFHLNVEAILFILQALPHVMLYNALS